MIQVKHLMKRWIRVIVVTVVVVQLGSASSFAQDKSSDELGSGDKATVERIMNTAVRNIARRYNLNEAQTEKTMEIMHREVYRFLTEHEDQVWPLIRDFLSQQGVGQPPSDVEQMKRIGKSARPMMDLIHEAIARGNKEWRMFLTEEQKVMHDYDMAEIDKTFEKANETLERWTMGDASAGGVFPPPPPPSAGPRRPPAPPTDELPPPEITGFDPNRLFSVLVDNFIKKYRLNQSQIDAARSILEEYKIAAIDFKNSNKTELKVIGAKWLAAQEAGDRKMLRQAESEKKKLLTPVHVMRGQMEERLMALLTTAQKDRVASMQKPTPRKQVATRATAKTAHSQKVSPGTDSDATKPQAKKVSAKPVQTAPNTEGH